MKKWLTVAGFVALAIGCAPPPGSVQATRSPDFISESEIRATNAATAHDLVLRLRPTWLSQTAPGSLQGTRMQRILVYMDETRLGGIEALESVGAAQVRSIRFLNATRAPTVLRGIGSEAIAGAIVILTTSP